MLRRLKIDMNINECDYCRGKATAVCFERGMLGGFRLRSVCEKHRKALVLLGVEKYEKDLHYSEAEPSPSSG